MDKLNIYINEVIKIAINILFKRGINTFFSTISLKSGEPAFVTDSGKLYIGDGTKKVLINPIDKPSGINTSNYYSKTKVNEYGQVIAQTDLAASDIPVIPSSQISGLGTASKVNVGTGVGNVPLLDSTSRLSESVMPLSVSGSGAMAYYNNSLTSTISTNQFVPLNGYFTSSNNYSLDANGIITINQTGIYSISYSITSNSLQLHTALAYTTYNNWIGSYARSTTTAVVPYTSTSATIMRQITSVPEKYGIKNLGPVDIILNNGYANLSIVKIGT